MRANWFQDLTATSVRSGDAPYTWQYVLSTALRHRRELVLAHVIAFAAALMSIPIPLLMPLMVDEVLLEQPGTGVALMNLIFPTPWRGPVLYIGAVLAITVVLRLAALGFNVWQTREFTCIAKDVTYRMRRELLMRLERVSMAEYETLGTGAVTSYFVTDMGAIDEFVGTTVGRFLIALLSLVGIAAILLWMHWPLAVFILCMNPLVVYFTIVLGKRMKELKRRENAAFEMFQEALTETLDVIQQIRASNRERHYLARVIDRAQGVRDHALDHALEWPGAVVRVEAPVGQ